MYTFVIQYFFANIDNYFSFFKLDLLRLISCQLWVISVIFMFAPKWWSSIGRWQKKLGRFNKSSYKLVMKYKYLIILLWFWLHVTNQILKYSEFYYFDSSLLIIENLQNHFTSKFWLFNLTFWQNFALNTRSFIPAKVKQHLQ